MIDTETMVKAYLNLRSARERLARQYEHEDSKLLKDMSSIEKVMMEACDNVNATSIKTTKGTIIKSVRERFGCSDWDMFNKFVYDHNALELFEKRSFSRLSVPKSVTAPSVITGASSA